MRKTHVHDEQFDGWLHAACGATDLEPPSERVVSEDDFADLPYGQRCRKCARVVWPHGGEPWD